MNDQETRISWYRQWRSQRFSEIVGQDPIVQTLRNAVRSGDVAHAYLFAGERGIGKTSAARILARAVNCLQPDDGEPCNECGNCSAILANRTLDIVEIDGASNRGIDHIRQLREEVNFAPTDLKRKVYIIDEVHMLTNEAFNALLKTLEEPPAHAMFVFATTEPHKVPRTIISRCQAFDFRRIADDAIEAHLEKIAAAMAVEVDVDARRLIARRANGGMRDALVMLEQVASYGGEAVSVDVVLDMLGLADHAVHEAFVTGIEQQDQATILTIIDELIDRGKDLDIFLSDVVTLLRDRLKQARPDAASDIRISQGLLDIKTNLFRSLDRRIRLEIGVLALMNSLPSAESPAKAASVQVEAGKRERSARRQTPQADVTPAPKTVPETQNAAEDADAAPPQRSTSQRSSRVVSIPDECRSNWEAMLAEIQQDRIAIAAFLIEGSPSLQGDKLVISFHPEDSFHKDSLEMRDNLTYLAGAVRRSFGDEVHVEIRADDSVERKPLPHEILMDKARMICDVVDGKIVKEDW